MNLLKSLARIILKEEIENEQINHYAGVCICGVYGARPKP